MFTKINQEKMHVKLLQINHKEIEQHWILTENTKSREKEIIN